LEGFSSLIVRGFKEVKDEAALSVEDADDEELAGVEVEENGLDKPLVKEDKVELAVEVLESTVCFICPGILLTSSV
jgi:hypothetical protein